MTERMGLAAVGRQNRQRAALARRAELRPAARRLAAVAVGFAGGWAVVYGALMPFGLGFVLGFAEDCFAPCAAGAALGVLLHGFGALSLRSVCMLCALGAAVAARWMGARTLTPAALAGCGTLVGVALCFAFGGGGAELVFYSAADALLAAAMGFCLRQFAPEKPGAGMLLVGAAAAAALGSVQLWQLLPGVIVCAALELYLCSKGQAKAALAACAVLGAALCAADPALSFAASGLACATVAAAVLAPGRRMETVAAYAGGCVTGALCVQPPGSAFQYLLNVCIGITAVAAMPAAWLVPEPEEKPQAGQAQPQQYSAAATRLEQVSQSLASLAETVNDVYETLPHRREDFHWVIDNTHDTLCFNCGRRDTCWKQEYAATLEGMEALRPLLESSGGLETTQLPGQLSRCIHPAALCAAANRSFALYRSRKEARLHAEAMRTALTEQYSAVAEALGVLGEQLGRPGDPEPYKSGRVADFFAQLGTPPQECAVTLDDLGRTHAAVTLPRTRFSAQELAALAGEVGRICRRTLEVPQVLSCKGMTTLLFSEKPVLRAVFGMAGAAARGSISGDAVQQFCSPAAAQMILCDGMGTGRPAAVDGNLAAELTARLLKAGFTAELAARLVNVALALKSEDESGATLDLISVDLYTGTARLFKAGAAPGFLVHGGRVRAVGDTSLPVGILGGVNGQEPGGAFDGGRLCGAGLGRAAGGRSGLGGKAAGAFRCGRRSAGKSCKDAGGNGPRARPEDRQAGRHYGGGAAAGKMRLMFIQTSLIFDGGEGILWKHRNKTGGQKHAYHNRSAGWQRRFCFGVRSGAGRALCLRSRDPHWPGRLPRKAGVRKTGYHPDRRRHGEHPHRVGRRRQAAAPGRQAHPHLPQLYRVFPGDRTAGAGPDH